jgi:hypothetical protein
MNLPEPEDLWLKYQTGQIGILGLLKEMLPHLIVLIKLVEVLLQRINTLNRDIQFIADQQGLTRPSQRLDPRRQTDTHMPGDGGGDVPSSS